MGTAIVMRGVSAGGTESAIAQIDVPMNGNLIGVEWSGRSDLDADGEFQFWQLSFGSAANETNDARQVIAMSSAGFLTVLTAVGTGIGVCDKYTRLPDISVGMGERLFLHSIASAGVVGLVYAILHFDFDLDKVAVRRR